MRTAHTRIPMYVAVPLSMISTIDLFITQAMPFIWLPGNDGRTFHLTPHDIGGCTAWGVTYSSWVAWEKQHGRVPTLSAFRETPRQTFLPFFRAGYWNACQCGDMGPIGVQVFDAAANCGPGHAAAFLQTVLGVKVDDEIGPLTLAAMEHVDHRDLAASLCSQREAFYATRQTARYFERGWDARAERCRDLVVSLLSNEATQHEP